MGVQFAGNILVQSNGGPLPISSGGTGQTTAPAALTALLPSQSGNNGKILTTNGTSASWLSGVLSPGGADTQIQFNDAGSFGANANFVINKSTGAVTSASTFTGTGSIVSGLVETTRALKFQTAGSDRWLMQTTSTAESGSSVGSNFEFVRVADNGATTNLVYTVSRATGAFDFKVTPTVNGGAIGGVVSFNTRTGAITLTSTDVTDALGFTPYNATNPSGYTANAGTVTSVGGTGTVSGLTLTGSVTTSGNLTLGGTLSLTSGDVTTALGFTPLNKAGDTVNGSLTFTAGTVTGLAAPSAGTDATTKNYVDAAIAGLSWKISVRVATTVNITLSGTQTIDGVAVVATNRVLVKNQTTTADNGIYVVSASTWTRAADADSAAELDGSAVYVQLGTTQADTGWTETATIATVGTDPIVYAQFSGSGSYAAGTGLSLTGNTFANTGVTSNVAGTNVTVSGATGAVTIGLVAAPTLTGTNFTGIPNAGLTNSSVTVGSTSISLGATATTLAGLTSVTSTAFVGALTGNASTATTSTNATNTSITDDTTTAATMYPTWVTSTTGNVPQKTTSTKLTFNPSTGVLSSTTFVGALNGTVGATTPAAGTFTTIIAAGGPSRFASVMVGADTDILMYESATNAMTVRTGAVGAEKYTTFAADGSLTVASGGITSVGNSALGSTESTNTHAIKGATTLLANSASAALTVTQTGAGNAFVVEDSASTDSTPFVIDASGALIVGHTATLPINASAYLGEFFGSGSNYPLAAGYTGASTTGPRFALVKNRSAAWGTHTVVNSGDTVGQIDFDGSDGTNFLPVARIEALVDGTPGTNDMPGRLVFSTTADGASGPTERLRIDSAGGLRWNGSVGIGIGPTAGYKHLMYGSLTGATTYYSYASQGTFQSDVVDAGYGYRSGPSTAASTFTLSVLCGYIAEQGTIGAGSTVTNQIGFHASANLTGATNNYGFYSNIAAGTGRWNLYMAGTARNYMAGNLNLGSATDAGTLHLKNLGTITFDSTTPFASSTAGFQVMKYSDTNAYVDNYDGDLIFRGAAFAQRMRITAAGQVKVNNTVVVNDIGTVGTATLTTAATTAGQVLNSVAIATYRVATYKVSITSGAAYHYTEISILQDGTNVYITEINTMKSGATLATFTADISAGNMRLLTTPTNAVTTYKAVSVLIAV